MSNAELIRVQTAKPARMTRLSELEQTIAKGMTTFVDVGKALMEIRNKKLYQEQGYSTFEDYCRKRWTWGRHYVNRQIKAAEIAEMVPIGTKPKNEAQARELTQLEPEEIKEVAEKVDFSKATAKEVREAVNEVKSKAKPKVTYEYEEPDQDDWSVEQKLIERVLALVNEGIVDKGTPEVLQILTELRDALNQAFGQE